MKIKSGLVLRRVGDDYIIVEPMKGVTDMTKVFTLNESAAWLWMQIENTDFTEDFAVELLLGRYDVKKEKALEDVRQLIAFLESQELLLAE
ncbi:MAG: PqqD family protein [Dysgonamonadaceae bacterium]|jgi:hypothetical protein|nr:PqqD family protein [Dysgonamonadaceae bacterium]